MASRRVPSSPNPDFYRDKNEFKVGHVVAQVFAPQAFVFFVFRRREAEGGAADFGGQNGVFTAFLHATRFRFLFYFF